MPWNLDADRPIFLQILERIRMDIISGKYTPGEKLPSVRELAAQAAVNPNTMQRAFAELERTGLVYSKRTSGRFITEDQEMIDTIRADLAKEKILQFLESMHQLGYEKEQTLSLMRQAMEREDAKQ
ncbi:MAG: GntR family transcriptional regulator [Eubacterium sp.]|jgi:DNA-binding transcriptional regulator YhcF (GntR family)|nr:GntR family transcriptional regulator [Eubacterium sp.]